MNWHPRDDDPATETLAAYEQHAEQYIEHSDTAPSPLVGRLMELSSPGSLVLELGTGPGRDALALEGAGFIVDRTEGAESFVALLRKSGHAARVLDIRADDFGGPYDAVFANAVLLHLRCLLQGGRRGGVVKQDVERTATFHLLVGA